MPDSIKRALYYPFFWIVLLSLGLHIVSILLLGTWNNAEQFEYSTVALNISQGKGYYYPNWGTEIRVYGFPLYPLMLWLMLEAFGSSVWPAQLLSISLNAGSAILCFQITRKLTQNKLAPFIAAFVFAMHPGLIYYAVSKVHELPLVCFSTLGIVLLGIRLLNVPSLINAGLLGVFLGAGYLLRPTIAAIGPGILLAYLVIFRDFDRNIFRLIIFSAFVALLVASPWWVRNRLVLGEWVLSTSGSAELFWQGNNPKATGTNLSADGRSIYQTDSVLVNKVRGLDEVTRSDIFKEEALKFIRNNPGTAAWFTVKKTFYFWWFTPHAGMYYRPYQLWGYKLYYFFVIIGLLLFLISAKLNTPEAKGLIVIMLFVLFAAMVAHSITYIEGRHRWGYEGYLVCMAGAGMASLRGFWKSRRKLPKGRVE